MCKSSSPSLSPVSYDRIRTRLGVTVVCITVTSMLWVWNHPQPQPQDYVSFENYWLTCAYFISLIITGHSFGWIYFRKQDETMKKEQEEKIKKVGFYGFFVCLAFFAIFLFSAIFSSSSYSILTWLPLVVAVLVWVYDALLWKAGLPGLQDKKKWSPFDSAIVVGVLAAILIRQYLPGLSDELRCVFNGGATSFQLIIANVVFDPKNYQ